ncbi:MAG: NnrS family protein [Emcibacteraceae bacterium]
MQSLFEHPFLGRGFRPFFFLGAAYSVINIFIWAFIYSGKISPPSFYFDPVSWHSHEMIYGFVLAIVSGFLLTAVANWTGGAPARQVHLAGLCLLWLFGRLAVNIDIGLPYWGIVIAELLFLPALTISLTIPLLKSWNTRNFIFLSFLTGLFACDLWFLLVQELEPLYIAIIIILMMISLVGGRIIPAFTVGALRQTGLHLYQTPQTKMDAAALISLLAVVLSIALFPNSLVLFFAALISSLIHLIRMRHYHTLKTRHDPMLWVLHLGYCWLIIGLFLISLTGLNILTMPMIIHALTIGAIGTMILGMICRVTLGHTGRNLKASRSTMLAFSLIQCAALVRVIGPIIVPSQKINLVTLSASLWVICFMIYLVEYSPMLFSKRPDGRET